MIEDGKHSLHDLEAKKGRGRVWGSTDLFKGVPSRPLGFFTRPHLLKASPSPNINTLDTKPLTHGPLGKFKN
jgi:hypothetical protein